MQNLLEYGICKTLLVTKKDSFACHSYEGITKEGLHHIAEATEQYIFNISKMAAELCENSGRNLTSFHDILNSIILSGISMDSLISFYDKLLENELNPVNSSGRLEDTNTYANVEDHSHASSKFDFSPAFIELMKDDQPPSTFPAFIPIHMPRFPRKHDYKCTPIYQHREMSDPVKMREHYTKNIRYLQEDLKLLIHRRDGVLVDILPSVTKISMNIATEKGEHDVEKRKGEDLDGRPPKYPTIQYLK